VILVVAGSYVEFLDYCRENSISPQSRPRPARYIQSYTDFFGVEEAELVVYGSYAENPLCKSPDLWNFLIEYGKTKKWKMSL
jgi:hypothetical protein